MLIRTRQSLFRYIILALATVIIFTWFYRGPALRSVYEQSISLKWPAAYHHFRNSSWRTGPTASKTVDDALPLVSEALESENAQPYASVSSTIPSTTTIPKGEPWTSSSTLPCAAIDGIADIVFVVKTGATESLERVPIHLETTFKCFPHTLIFSDYAEEIEGFVVQDALDAIVPEIRLNHEDFDHWRKLHQDGREGLDQGQMGNHVAADDLGAAFQNGGWKIDRFKNLQMVLKALDYNHDAKWYVFTDADTYISSSNLLSWTRQMDHTKGIYLGAPTVIDEQIFGHGGSGYLLSNAAMHAVAEQYRSNQTAWDEFTARHWAGDCVLSHVLSHMGIGLTWSYPMIQGKSPTYLDFVNEVGYDRRLWCYPAVSYHHVKRDTVESMWRFEQLWIADMPGVTLRHSDVFLHWLLPQLSGGDRPNWDNLSGDILEGSEISDAEGCRAACERWSRCLQFSYRDGVCKTSTTVLLGSADEGGTYSGWIEDRILKLKVEPCQEGEWILG
jgi:hypothetical protein